PSVPRAFNPSQQSSSFRESNRVCAFKLKKYPPPHHQQSACLEENSSSWQLAPWQRARSGNRGRQPPPQNWSRCLLASKFRCKFPPVRPTKTCSLPNSSALATSTSRPAAAEQLWKTSFASNKGWRQQTSKSGTSAIATFITC